MTCTEISGSGARTGTTNIITPVRRVDDPQGPTTGVYRVMRGGGWDDTPIYYRSAARLDHSATFCCPRAGFRVVCEVEEL